MCIRDRNSLCDAIGFFNPVWDSKEDQDTCFFKAEAVAKQHAALLRSLQVAGTTEFQVGLGDTETVVRIAHDINTFAGFF